jgi:outer membrane receptor for ferric coprogen and ferric-rhodotorulic acid
MSQPNSFLRATALLSLLALFTSVLPSLRAEDTAGTATDKNKEEVVELAPVEVTAEQIIETPAVTSTRLPLTIRETPQSINVINRNVMEEQNLFSVDDVLRNVTGVHTAFYDTERPLYFARGFQITDFQVDGIPSYSGSTNQEYDTAIYESVTVIRGANSLISGAGIPSAVIDLKRKRPGKEFDASASVSAGSWNLFRSEIDVTAPFTEDGRFRGRFVVFGETTDSFLDRYSDETSGFLASFEGDLTATTTVGMGYQFQKNTPDNPMWGTIPWFASDGSEANLPRTINFSTDWTYWKRESGTAFINLDQKLGENWNFRGSYNRTEGETQRLAVYALGNPNLATGGGINLLAGANDSTDIRDNIDLYLSGKFTAFDREHDAVLGWNLNNYESDANTVTVTDLRSNPWGSIIPDYRTYNGVAPVAIVTKTGASRITHTKQDGVYGMTRLRVTDPLSVILGARLSNWETYVDNYNTSNAFINTTGRAETTSELTPYVGFVYELTKHVSLYASYTETFKPQTQKDKNFDIISPALGTNAEVGFKADLIKDRLEANVAVFETKQDNFAIVDASQPPNSLPDGTTPYIGVDGTESRGVEVEFNATLTTDWVASIGYSNINTRRNPVDLTYANVPEHIVHFTTNYRLPGDWNRLSIGGGVNWQGEQTGVVTTHPTANPAAVSQDSFFLVNLFTTYRFTDHFTGTVSVRNLFDKTYWATLDYPNYGEPRSFQVTLRWNY